MRGNHPGFKKIFVQTKKRAALFSILAMMLAALLFIMLIPSTETPVKKNSEISKTRVRNLNSFISSADPYFQTVLLSSAPETMDALTDSMIGKGFFSQQALQCSFEKMLADGRLTNVSQTPQTRDLAFQINGGVMDGYDSVFIAPPLSDNYPYVQRFLSRNKAQISNATAMFAYFFVAPTECSIHAYIFNELCGEPGRILGYADMSYTFLGNGYYNITLGFQKKIPVERGEPLYYMVDSNCSGTPGVNRLFAYTVDPSVIPESNMSSAGLIAQTYFQNNSINYFAGVLEDYAKENTHSELNTKLNSAKVSQSEPWSLDITLNITYFLEDRVASWEKNSRVTQKISILGLKDPFFAHGTSGLQNRKIKRDQSQLGIWDLKINTTQGNITSFTNFYAKGNYIVTSTAPNFLMRYTNNTNASGVGITTLVNSSYPEIQNASYTDYYYFSGRRFSCAVGELMNLSSDPLGIFSHFKLDRVSVAYYGFGTAGDTNFSEYTC